MIMQRQFSHPIHPVGVIRRCGWCKRELLSDGATLGEPFQDASPAVWRVSDGTCNACREIHFPQGNQPTTAPAPYLHEDSVHSESTKAAGAASFQEGK